MQNGYGFVLLPDNEDGIRTAQHIVSSLRKTTIHQTTFDCSLSNRLLGKTSASSTAGSQQSKVINNKKSLSSTRKVSVDNNIGAHLGIQHVSTVKVAGVTSLPQQSIQQFTVPSPATFPSNLGSQINQDSSAVGNSFHQRQQQKVSSHYGAVINGNMYGSSGLSLSSHQFNDLPGVSNADKNGSFRRQEMTKVNALHSVVDGHQNYIQAFSTPLFHNLPRTLPEDTYMLQTPSHAVTLPQTLGGFQQNQSQNQLMRNEAYFMGTSPQRAVHFPLSQQFPQNQLLPEPAVPHYYQPIDQQTRLRHLHF